MGTSIMQMDQVALSAIKNDGYMVVAKAGQNNRVALSEIGKQSDVETLDADIGKVGGSIAPAYDSTNTYAKGDLVMYARELYECTTDISVAEEYTPGHWSMTTVSQLLTENIAKDYDPETTYFAGACVKHNGEFYLFDSTNVVTGNFDSNKWKKIDLAELNKFINIEFTADANDYAYCNFSYNPFLKIVLGHINVKFSNVIQQSYNLNDLRIQFNMPFVGYGASSSFAIDSSNRIMYPTGSQVCCQLLDIDVNNIRSGVSFWTNGVGSVYGMFTCQVFAWIETEHKNN